MNSILSKPLGVSRPGATAQRNVAATPRRYNGEAMLCAPPICPRT
jgi:hypothetical protein